MNKIFLIIGVFTCIVFAGCDNWAEDFNINKNVPLTLSTDPSSFIGAMLSGPIGDSRMEWVAFNSIHPVIGYWGRTESLSQGARHRAWHDFDSKVWQNCYPTLTNVKNVRRSAEFSKLPQYIAVADIWESWIMCTLTNFYGDVPYFAAVKDTVVYTVNYDKQSEIYPAILAKLKIANDIIAATPVNITATPDYIYAGDIQKWRKFANTLRLRMCMYMYNANPALAKNIMTEILGDKTKYPIFESNNDNCMMHYDGSSNARTSMIYHENAAKWEKELLMSNIMIQRLITLKDPRLPIYAYPVKKVHTESGYITPTNPGTDKYLGHINGLTTSNDDAVAFNGGPDYASTLGPWFRPLGTDGKPTKEAANTPCFLATYPEMLFFLAEASQRGIISGDAKKYYEDGVKAAFAQYGATFGTTKYIGAFASEGLSSETDYLNQTSVNWDGGRDKLTLIAEQKWIASFFLMLEPYFDHRRTMLPKLSCSNRAALSTDGSGTKFPSRADYPASEELTNKEGWNNARKTGYDIVITGDNNRTLARMWLINNTNSPSLQMPIYMEPLNEKKDGVVTANNQYPGNPAFQAWWDANWKTLYWWEYE